MNIIKDYRFLKLGTFKTLSGRKYNLDSTIDFVNKSKNKQFSLQKKVSSDDPTIIDTELVIGSIENLKVVDKCLIGDVYFPGQPSNEYFNLVRNDVYIITPASLGNVAQHIINSHGNVRLSTDISNVLYFYLYKVNGLNL